MPNLDDLFAYPPGGDSARDAFCRFLASPRYILSVMLLTALSNLFGCELIVYTLFIGIAVYTCLWGKDLLPLAPLVFSSYIAPSIANNPGRNPDSIFSPAKGGVLLLFLAALLIAVLILHMIRHRQRFFSRKPKLLSGMLFLAAAYLLSGIGSDAYPGSLGPNLLFAFLQGCALIVPYWVLWHGVDWKYVRKDYFCWIGFATGCVLVIEILGVYFSGKVIVNGVIERQNIYTGWGMYNNMGGMLAMMLPFAFYLATKYRKGWIGTVVGSVFLIGILLTCSRTSIITGFCAYIACILLTLRHGKHRKSNSLALIIICGCLLLAFILFHKPLLRLFSKLLELGADPSNRDTIFQDGLGIFKEYPLLGGSFFSPGKKPWDWSNVDSFSAFFPPRWHNTFVQLLATCGIVGLLAYLSHRIQTVKLFYWKRSRENSFIGISLLILLICSQFDCHFFNIGPVLFYSMALAFTERLRTEK